MGLFSQHCCFVSFLPIPEISSSHCALEELEPHGKKAILINNRTVQVYLSEV